MDHAPHRDRAQLVISGVLIALGLFMFYQIQLIVADGGYSAIGPRFSPTLVAGVLLLIGVLLLRQARTGGWRNMEGAVPAEPFFAPAFLWIAGGLALNMVVIGFIGFTIASALLYVMVARGFGSRRLGRDSSIGLVLALAVFYFFTRVLGLALPASPAGFI
jgi:putative tricarboxylic transport membrane protein